MIGLHIQFLTRGAERQFHVILVHHRIEEETPHIVLGNLIHDVIRKHRSEKGGVLLGHRQKPLIGALKVRIPFLREVQGQLLDLAILITLVGQAVKQRQQQTPEHNLPQQPNQ